MLSACCTDLSMLSMYGYFGQTNNAMCDVRLCVIRAVRKCAVRDVPTCNAHPFFSSGRGGGGVRGVSRVRGVRDTFTVRRVELWLLWLLLSGAPVPLSADLVECLWVRRARERAWSRECVRID